LIEVILLLVILVAFGIRTTWFQTFAAQQVASYLSNQLGTEITIDKVDIAFVDLIDLEGIYVEDKVNDTLLYAQKIRVDIGTYDLSQSMIGIETVELNNATVNIVKYQGDSTLNFQHFVDYFASAKKDTTSSNFTVDLKKLSLNGIEFKYQDQNEVPAKQGLDFSDIHIKQLSGNFSDFSMKDEKIKLKIEDITFKEKSGFLLTKLTTELNYSPTEIALNNLRLGLGNSLLISDYFKLKTPNGASDFSDFVRKVEFDANLRDSKIALNDLAYLVPSIYGMEEVVSLNNVKIDGPVYRMKLREFDLSMLDSTILRGSFKIPTDLDDPEAIYFEEKVTLFQTSVDDISKLKLTPFLNGNDYIELPKNMLQAGLIKLTDGHFTGALNDFSVDGNITSGFGDISSEYGLRFKKENDIYYYDSGIEGNTKDIIINNLDLAALTGNDVLGITTGYLTIKKGSRGLSLDDMNLDFIGKFETIELNDYSYNGIVIKEGNFSNNRFDGVIDVEDDNLALNYDGYVDLNNDLKFDFDVEIDSAALSELNNRKDGFKDRFESTLDVKIQGTSLNEIRGTVEVHNLKYKGGELDFQLDDLRLDITRNEESDSIVVKSELIDIELTGKFDLTQIWPVIQHQLARVADNVINDIDISKIQNKFFKLKVNLKDANPLMQFVGHDIHIAENSKIESIYDLKKLRLDLSLSSDQIIYDGISFNRINFRSHFDSIIANLQYQIGGVKINDSLQVKNASLYSRIKDNELSTDLGWDGAGSVEPALFAFDTHIQENENILTEFKPSFFFLKTHKWEISPESKLIWNKDLIRLTKFKIKNGDHYVELKGRVSENPEDKLYFNVTDFDLTDLNGILGGTEIAGNLNLRGNIADVYNNIRLEANSKIKDFFVEGELVGDLNIKNKWNKENNNVEILGALKREGETTFEFDGNYFTELEKDNLKLDLIFDYTEIGFLNAFSDPELYEKISGKLNGRLAVTGELMNPVVDGTLDVVTANVFVPLFNVAYGISGEIDFGRDEIIVENMNTFDQEGNNALARMQIYHTNWGNWNYDITLDMLGPLVSERFLVMNTEYKEGDFYYGKAYVNGDVNISGYNGITEIGVDATTQSGTDLKLAMYGSSDLEENSFIVFDTIVPTYDLANLNEATSVSSTGLILDMNFDIGKDTKATIVFDPIYEDQIEIRAGEGNIAIKLDEYGEMNMRGKYEILDGNYFFRLKGAVKEDFVIRQGSTIEWTGSPYDALIDIGAEFTRETSLEPILPEGEADRSGETEIIKGVLVMTETLLRPNLNFLIEAEGLDEVGQRELNSILEDENQLSKQFFALLALKKFLPVHGGSEDGPDGENVVIGFAEDRVNDILAGVGDNYDLKADFKEGEASLGFQTQVNEKILIKSSLGVVSDTEEEEGGLIGDIVIEYKLNEDGTFTVNAFNESNQGTEAEKGPFTQGVSLHYEETFNTTKEFKLLQGFLNIFRKRENDVNYRKEKSNGRKIPIPKKLDTGEEGVKEEEEGF